MGLGVGVESQALSSGVDVIKSMAPLRWAKSSYKVRLGWCPDVYKIVSG